MLQLVKVYLHALGKGLEVVAAFEEGEDAALGIFVGELHDAVGHPAISVGG